MNIMDNSKLDNAISITTEDYIREAKALEELKKYSKAIIVYDKGFKTSNSEYHQKIILLSKVRILLKQQLWIKAAKVCNSPILRTAEDDEIRAIVKVIFGIDLFFAKKYEESLKLLEEGLNINPEVKAAASFKIRCLEKLNKTTGEIIKAENDALTTNLNNAGVVVIKTMRLLQEGDIERADLYLNRLKVLEIEDANLQQRVIVLCYKIKALILEKEGRKGEALDSINMALNISTNYYYKMMISIKARLLNSMGQYKKALKCCDEFLGRGEDDVAILREAAESYLGLGDAENGERIILFLQYLVKDNNAKMREGNIGQVLQFAKAKKMKERLFLT